MRPSHGHICHAVFGETYEAADATYSGKALYAETHHDWIDSAPLLEEINEYYKMQGVVEHDGGEADWHAWLAAATDDAECDDDANGSAASDGDDADADSGGATFAGNEDPGSDSDSAVYGAEDNCHEYTCSEPSCQLTMHACNAAMWMGDGEIYCLDCIKDALHQ